MATFAPREVARRNLRARRRATGDTTARARERVSLTGAAARESLPRRGLTLVELTVALSLAGLVLAMITAIAVRQQRIFGDLAQATSLEGQLREAVTVLPIDLRAISPALGDLRDARDTAIEFRATIGTSVVCDTAGTRLILYPPVVGTTPTRESARYSSLPTPLAEGDTAWLLSASDTREQWEPHAIQSVSAAAPGQCDRAAPPLDSARLVRARPAITLAGGGIVPGMPVRFTRPMRYSLYHASDNEWYLGERDWSASSGRFNTIQPVAGPFLSAALGGFQLSYFDSSDVALPMPITDLTSVARVLISVKGQTRGPVLAIGSAQQSGKRVDSARIAIAFRGSR
jgi:prepilin-type N-terminal cleavage/methylation domain-containing protein